MKRNHDLAAVVTVDYTNLVCRSNILFAGKAAARKNQAGKALGNSGAIRASLVVVLPASMPR